MTLFGMDGGARIGGLTGLSTLGLAVLILGGMGIGAASEGAWTRAVVTTGFGATATCMALVVQLYLSRRVSSLLRGIYAGIAGGPPAMIGLIALLMGAGHLTVNEWSAALFGLVVGLAGGFAAFGAWLNFGRSRTRVLPPFNPLSATAFKPEPDPPAYPRPRELTVAPQSRSGMLWRIRRALWLARR